MPSAHRRKPYSGRKKKVQLQEHRAKLQRRERGESIESPLEERLHRISTGHGLHARYQIPFMRFLSETQEQLLAAKERGQEPLHAGEPYRLPQGQLAGFWDAGEAVRLMRRPQWTRGETAETINTRESVAFSLWLQGLANVSQAALEERRADAIVRHERAVAQAVQQAERPRAEQRKARRRSGEFDFENVGASDSYSERSEASGSSAENQSDSESEESPREAPVAEAQVPDPRSPVSPQELSAAMARMPAIDRRVVTVVNYNQFEVNMRVWQELWRVLELADVACVLVDARFPAAHLPACLVDLLEDYGKPWIVAFHKADLVSEEHLVGWESALRRVFPSCSGSIRTAASWEADKMRADLVETVRRLHEARDDASGRLGHHAVCLLGQPSVGKSSLLNALMGRKITRTSRTPGCSKHLQTGFMPVPGAKSWNESQSAARELLLIDCPGVIFPVRDVDRALFVVTGVVPLGRTREFLSPVRLLLETQPQALRALGVAPSVWKKVVGRPDPSLDSLTPLKVLSALAERHKLTLSHGRYDIHRAGISLMKSVVDGELTYMFEPPTEEEIDRFARQFAAYRAQHAADPRPARSPDDELDVAGDTSSGDSEILEEEF